MKTWVAQTAERLASIKEEQLEQDKCDKEILERMNALEKQVEKLVVKMGIVYTIVMAIIMTALKLVLN